MRKIFSFYKFILENKEIDKERIFLSKQLFSFFDDISENEIAKAILNTEYDEIESDISYIDMTDKEDVLSFITVRKLRVLEKDNDISSVWKKHRVESKIGRIAKKIFGDRFTPKEIEEFVNLYKTKFNLKKNALSRFEIVSGEDLVKWYHEDNYEPGGGTLNNSCMRYARYIDLYKENPDKIKMVILKGEDPTKIIGRALLWTVNVGSSDSDNVRQFMDRIYTKNDYDVELFKEYARANKLLFKDRQSFGRSDIIVDGDSGHSSRLKMYVTGIDYNGKYYPYVDTLSIYDVSGKILTNDDDIISDSDEVYELNQTSGGYTDFNETMVTDINGDRIREDDARWSEHHSEYLHYDNSVWSDYHSDYFLPDDTVWSEYINDNILSNDSVYSYVMRDNLPESYVIGFQKDHNGNYDYAHEDNIHDYAMYDEESGDYYANDLFVSDVNGDDVLEINTYIVVYNDETGKYEIDESNESDLRMRKKDYDNQ